MSDLFEVTRPIRVEVNAHYYSLGHTYIHCGDMLDALYCVTCDEQMPCYYCEHDYREAHEDCEGI